MAYPSWVKQEVRSKKIKSILEKITIWSHFHLKHHNFYQVHLEAF
jgi:hypothetical protein